MCLYFIKKRIFSLKIWLPVHKIQKCQIFFICLMHCVLDLNFKASIFLKLHNFLFK